MSPLPLGLRHHQRPVTPRAAGDEDLPAVDDELVSVALRHRGDAGDVGARIRLGYREGGDLVTLDGRDEPATLLLLGAELENGRRCHLSLHRHGHTQAATADPGELFREDHGGEVVTALAAVLERVAETQEAKLAETPEDRVGEGLLLPILEI